MSRRLLEKGRYPKAPAVAQITSNSSQFPTQALTQCPGTSEIPGYPSTQSQPAQNMWSQPHYPNPSSYQPNPPVDPSNYWSQTQMYSSQVQQPSDPWNWPAEGDATYANNQPQQDPNFQQPNLSYQQQHPNSSYHQSYVQRQQPEANYQNFNSNYQQPQQLAPVFQHMDPTYQQNLQPVYQQHHQFDSNSQQYQHIDPSPQSHPQLDPNFQQMFDHNQQLSNPNPQPQIQPDFNFQKNDEQVPNFQGHQESNPISFIQSDSNLHHLQVNSAECNNATQPQADHPNYSLGTAAEQNPNHMSMAKPIETEQPLDSTSNNIPNYDGWDETSLSITEPAELPWTYGAPQYSNPTTNPADFPSGSRPSNAPVNLSSLGSVNANSLDYLPNNSKEANSYINNHISEPQDHSLNESKDDSDSSNINDFDTSSIVRDLGVDADYGSNSLSAFFHTPDFNNSGNDSDFGAPSTPDVKNTLDSSSLDEHLAHLQINDNERSSVPTEDEQDEQNLEDTDDCENQEVNLPEENVNLSIDDEEKESVAGFIEEPINQEVPEPNAKESTALLNQVILVNQDYHKMSPEEPFNQQIPTGSGDKSRSASTERVVIRPREESPFKPPRINGTSKGTVVQQEALVLKNVEQKTSENKTVVQEVNLETVPDNLERPPDYAELQKQSSFYVSHMKHLRTELNSSPSSLLCDKPDIPCVTLAPAAPPIHSSSKSDKSESSSDSRREMNAYEKTEVLKKESNTSSPANVDSELSEKSLSSGKSYPASRTENSNQKYAQPMNKTGPAQQLQQVKQPNNETNHNNSAKHIKESRVKDVRHLEDYPRQTPNIENLQNPNYNLDYSSRHSDYSSKSRNDPRYPTHDAGYSRQKFADKKYPSFDERQYYSDRERSRPPSRSSLDDRSEDYRYPPKPKDPRDYPYIPRDDRQHGHPDYDRPPSRMSESDMKRIDRHSHYDYYKQPYPYGGQYAKNQDYYPKAPGYRGYDYDPYQRDPYYATYYDAYRHAYNNYNYGFYDELYRADPSRYRQYQEQYRQYYAKYGYEGEYERLSAHSGRSSANELTKDMSSSQYPDMSSNASEISAYNIRQDYSYDEMPNDVSVLATDQSSTSSARLTPAKFPYAHPIARFSPGGILVTAIPSQVDSTLSAPVKIQTMQSIMENEDSYQELKIHQGPLVRGSTHKKDVIEFCNQKIKLLRTKEDVVDRDSYILLWELSILMLRQNGSVVGSDIAELLLKDHDVLRPQTASLRNTIETPQSEQSPADVNDSSSQSHAGDTSSPDEGIVVVHDKNSLNTLKTVDVDKVTWKFREFLLFGHKKDALEWAIKHCLWGHALFLASKMDLRTYANVMTRFANSLALNDPLQTLYQLMSGRQPSAVTCVADKKWGDWRPHLAMILSNPSGMPDVDSRSITTLGDTLASRGCLPAAHFCYVMAQVEFGTFEDKSSKLVLLSADHRLPFEEFATNEAIQCTEIYEYAQSLANPTYSLIHLQIYKFIYALRLVEHGFLEEALHYCEEIARRLVTHPVLYSYDLISEVFKLSSQLKYHDPHFFRGHGEFEDQDDPEWLNDLANLVQDYINIINEQHSQTQHEPIPEPSTIANEPMPPPIENVPYQNGSQATVQSENSNSMNNTSYYQQTSPTSNNTFLSNNQPDITPFYQTEQQQWCNNQNAFQFESSIPSHEDNETTDVPSSPITQTPPFDYYSNSTQQEWSSVHSIPSVTLSDVVGGQTFTKSELEKLLQKEEVESDIILCSSAHSTPLHNYLLSKDDSDDRQMLMTSHSVDGRTLNSCLKSKHSSNNSKNKKCIKFDSNVSGHQGKLQRAGIRRRKFSKRRNEMATQSDSSPEGSPSKEKHKSKLSLLATLGILRSDTRSQKLTKRKRKAKKKNETIEKLMQSKKTFAIDEPCDTDEIQKQRNSLETKKIIGILKRLEDEKKNSELGQLMANEFNKKPPLIFGGTYPIDEPFESKTCNYSFKNLKAEGKHSQKNRKNIEISRKAKSGQAADHLKAKNPHISEKVEFSQEERLHKMSPLKIFKKIHSFNKNSVLCKIDTLKGLASTSGLNDNLKLGDKDLSENIVSDSKRSSYDQVSSFASTTRRERQDSAMSSGSRYSAGSLSSRKPSVKETTKTEPKKETKPSSQAGKTWLGGIFSRLLPRAPNQMILPDDKNPTIVWDEVQQRWVNKDSNDEDESNAPLAPPTDMELMGSQSSEKPTVPPGNSMPPIATSPINKFQRPKTRGMRQNYVDVLSNSGATTKTNVSPEALFPTQFEQPTSTNMFIPQPASHVGENAELESTNSYNNPSMEPQEQSQAVSAPLMFDPAEFDSRGSGMVSQRHTIGRTGRRTYPT